jgi:hypothetical protein
VRLSVKFIVCIFTETVISVNPLIVIMYKNGSAEGLSVEISIEFPRGTSLVSSKKLCIV